MVNEYVQPWYAGFIDGLDREMLFEVILAANYMVQHHSAMPVFLIDALSSTVVKQWSI
jgi:hypothetical protein